MTDDKPTHDDRVVVVDGDVSGTVDLGDVSFQVVEWVTTAAVAGVLGNVAHEKYERIMGWLRTRSSLAAEDPSAVIYNEMLDLARIAIRETAHELDVGPVKRLKLVGVSYRDGFATIRFRARGDLQAEVRMPYENLSAETVEVRMRAPSRRRGGKLGGYPNRDR